MRTIKDHARNVKTLITYVPANVSGVVYSFSEWMRLATDLGMNTQQRNEHPITKGYMIGLSSIYKDDMSKLYEEVTDADLDKIIDSKEIEGL